MDQILNVNGDSKKHFGKVLSYQHKLIFSCSMITFGPEENGQVTPSRVISLLLYHPASAKEMLWNGKNNLKKKKKERK